jgi:Flp pilus assembly pilin Flp
MMLKGRITIQSESAQTMAEYAVVLGVITLAVVASFSLLSDAVSAALERTLELVGSVV